MLRGTNEYILLERQSRFRQDAERERLAKIARNRPQGQPFWRVRGQLGRLRQMMARGTIRQRLIPRAG